MARQPTPPGPRTTPPPRNKALCSGLINHWFPLIRPGGGGTLGWPAMIIVPGVDMYHRHLDAWQEMATAVRNYHLCVTTKILKEAMLPSPCEKQEKIELVEDVVPINQGLLRGPPIMGPPFPYCKGFLWEWYGSSMGMGVPVLGGPWS